MSGRRFGVGRITHQDRPTEWARATPDGAKPQTGCLPGGERRDDQASARESLEGPGVHGQDQCRTARAPGASPHVADHVRMHAGKTHGRPRPAREGHGSRTDSALRTAGLPASAGSDERTRQAQPVRSCAKGTKAFDRKPERGKAQGGIGAGVTRVVTPAARTARGDEAQEPRPVACER